MKKFIAISACALMLTGCYAGTKAKKNHTVENDVIRHNSTMSNNAAAAAASTSVAADAAYKAYTPPPGPTQ